MAIHPLAVGPNENRAVQPFTDAQVDRSGGAGGERDRDLFGAFAQDPQCSMPTSVESCSISAPNASEIRSPFNASSDANAWSRLDDSPAATRNPPSSLRSNPRVWDS